MRSEFSKSCEGVILENVHNMAHGRLFWAADKKNIYMKTSIVDKAIVVWSEYSYYLACVATYFP